MKKFLLTSTRLPGINFILLIIRLWFGINMMKNGKYIFEKSELHYFQNWFGNELHFPAPILMFYLAKGSEFFGGLFTGLGLFTRIASFLIGFTMLIATITANKGNIFVMDGTITFAFLSFSLFFLFYGPGKWSLDYWLFDSRRFPN